VAVTAVDHFEVSGVTKACQTKDYIFLNTTINWYEGLFNKLSLLIIYSLFMLFFRFNIESYPFLNEFLMKIWQFYNYRYTKKNANYHLPRVKVWNSITFFFLNSLPFKGYYIYRVYRLWLYKCMRVYSAAEVSKLYGFPEMTALFKIQLDKTTLPVFLFSCHSIIIIIQYCSWWPDIIEFIVIYS